MVSAQYLEGRKVWDRPQAIIFSDVKFRVVNGGFVPPENANEGSDFIILSDHNRDAISMPDDKIEDRNRMINGTSRAYFTTFKKKLSTSWKGLPGRVAAQKLVFDQVTGRQTLVNRYDVYTADAAAGYLDMDQWYRNHRGNPFYVYLSYDDRGPGFSQAQYGKEYLMYIANFDGTLAQRGVYDFWNVTMSLEEV